MYCVEAGVGETMELAVLDLIRRQAEKLQREIKKEILDAPPKAH